MAAKRAARAARGLLATLLLGLALGTGAQILPEGEGDFPYRLEILPESPRAGGRVVLELAVAGLERARLGALELDSGLALESSSIRPLVDPEGRRGASLRLELRVLEPGPRRVESLSLEGEGGSLSLGPFEFEALPSEVAASLPLYRWAFPEGILRYAAFPLSLEPREASVGARLVSPSFSVPEGLFLEPSEGGQGAWIATALEEGDILLPALELGEGRVEARSLRVLPLPSELAESRAQGDFELALEAPPRARAGELLFFRLILTGRGNHPSLRFPRLQARLSGNPLPASALGLRRSEALQAASGGYEGASILEISLRAPGAGLLRLEVEELPVLDSRGRLRRLEIEPYELSVEEALPAPAEEPEAGAGSLLELAREAALGLGSARGGEALELLEEGEAEALLDLLSTLPPETPRRELLLVEAAAQWKRGERGRALALLLGLARRERGRAELRRAALEASLSLGAGPPLLDSLPRPALLLALALPLLLLGLLCLYLARRRGAAPGPGLLLAGLLLLCLALASTALGAAALAEGRREYAVAWTERLSSVPSEAAEGGLAIVPGQSGRVIGRAPGYLGLRFPDGSVGWAALDSVYSY